MHPQKKMNQIPGAASSFNLEVEKFEFSFGVFNLELPVDAL